MSKIGQDDKCTENGLLDIFHCIDRVSYGNPSVYFRLLLCSISLGACSGVSRPRKLSTSPVFEPMVEI
jgi:hypothetical protein